MMQTCRAVRMILNKRSEMALVEFSSCIKLVTNLVTSGPVSIIEVSHYHPPESGGSIVARGIKGESHCQIM